MLNRIYACEKNFLLGYLNKTENFDQSLFSDEKQAIFSREQKERRTYLMSVVGDTARLKISGVLSMDGPSFIDWLFGYGGTAYSEILDSLNEAEENESIKKIILEMDTPGGHVAGVDSVYMAIKSSKKEIIAENHGMIASAGYWIACACDKIIAIEQTCETGSIGVIIAGFDYSKAREDMGIKLVRIVSKNAPNKAATLEEKKGIKLLQDNVDSLERIFIERVAEGRSVEAKDVIENFGKGNIFIALDPDGESKDALNIGMIDGLELNGEIVTENAKTQGDIKNNKKSIDDSIQNNQNKLVENKKLNNGAKMTLAEFLKENPDAQKEMNSTISGIVSKQLSENKKIESEKTAQAEKEKQASADTEKAKKFLTGYPEAIVNLAVEVISGKQSIVALEAAASAIDSNKEANEGADAAVDTDELGETPAEQEEIKELSGDGVIKSEDDFQALIKRTKEAQA